MRYPNKQQAKETPFDLNLSRHDRRYCFVFQHSFFLFINLIWQPNTSFRHTNAYSPEFACNHPQTQSAGVFCFLSFLISLAYFKIPVTFLQSLYNFIQIIYIQVQRCNVFFPFLHIKNTPSPSVWLSSANKEQPLGFTTSLSFVELNALAFGCNSCNVIAMLIFTYFFKYVTSLHI